MTNRINIEVNALGNFSQIQTELTKLKSTISQLQSKPLLGSAGQETAKEIQKIQNRFDQMVMSTRSFNVEMVKMSDSVDRFGSNLEKGKLKLHDYFRVYRENAKGIRNDLDSLAERQARLGKSIVIPDALKTGYSRVITSINGDLKTLGATEDAAAIKAKALNTVIRGMGTELVNLGKNTQWAGRQLTVGLTVPLAAFGAAAAKSFQDVDKELTRLAKVYGDGLTQTSEKTISEIRKQTIGLANELAQTYGMAAQQTAAVAADLAATGLQGNDLLKATKETMRLSTLGELDQQSAIKATVALQRTFRLSTKDLTDSINYLNAVENQTSTSLGDLVEGLPRAAVVVRQLGGSYKDLSAMMVAMREAGVPAAEAANSIKSAMASIINPSARATKELKGFGIDIEKITKSNAGDLIGMIKGLQDGLDKLAPQDKVRMIEQLFGKFQFAKVTALIDNLGKAGSQTQKAFELAGASTSQLAKLAESELKRQTQSVSGKYNRAIQDFKTKILPLGEQLTKWATTAINVFNKFLDVLNKFAPLKKVFTALFGGLAVVGPVLMFVGLMGNLVGSLIKGANAFRMFSKGFKSGGLKEAFSSINKFYESIDVSALAASNNTEEFANNALNAVKAFEVLNLEIVKLQERLADVANNPITLSMRTSYSSMSDKELNALNVYERDSKQQGGERPHYTAKSDAMRLYRSDPSRTPDLQRIEQEYISRYGETQGSERFKRYFEEGQTAQYGMVQQGGAAALLQQRYGKENVIYGAKSGVSKESVYAREVERLVGIHDEILSGKIKDQALAAEQLNRILGTESKKGQALTIEQTTKLEAIVAQVTFAEEEMSNAVIDNLVQQKAVLEGSAQAVEDLNLEIKRIMTTGDPGSRAARIAVEWNAFLNTLSTEALSEIQMFRESISMQISGAASPQSALMAARNIEAQIAQGAIERGGIHADQLGPGETMGSQRIRSALVPFTPKIHRLQTGGSPWVPGSGDGDKVPALLEPGEFVVNKNAAKQYGGLLHDINFNKAPRFQRGDTVEDAPKSKKDLAYEEAQRLGIPIEELSNAVVRFPTSINQSWRNGGKVSIINVKQAFNDPANDPLVYFKHYLKENGGGSLDDQQLLKEVFDKLSGKSSVTEKEFADAFKLSLKGRVSNELIERIYSSSSWRIKAEDVPEHYKQFIKGKTLHIPGKAPIPLTATRTLPSWLQGTLKPYETLRKGVDAFGQRFALKGYQASHIYSPIKLQQGGGIPGFISGGSALEEIWGNGQKKWMAPQWQGPRLQQDFGFKPRLSEFSPHPFFATEAEAEVYRQNYLSASRSGSEKLDVREIFKFTNDETTLKALAEAWQQGPKKIRNHPEKLKSLLSFFEPIKKAMTLRRKTMLGIPGEMPDAQQIAILKALKDGDYESIIGQKFDLLGNPSAYTEWSPQWLLSREFHDHPLRMRHSKNMVSEVLKHQEQTLKQIADLKSSDPKIADAARKILEKRLSKMTSLKDRSLSEENIQRLINFHESTVARTLEEQRALSPMGIEPEDVIIQRLFGEGSSMLDITATNPDAKYRGTRLMEREWLATPGQATLDSISQTWLPPDKYTGLAHLYPEFVKRLPYMLNMKQRGGIQKFISGGRMLYKPLNKIYDIINYLKMAKLFKKGMFHGSYDGIEDISAGGGKLLFNNPGGQDVSYGGMQFFTTSNMAEARSYTTAPHTDADTEYSSVYRMLKAPLGKYVSIGGDSTPFKDLKNIKRQNYDLWKILSESGHDLSKIYPALEKLGIKGFMTRRPKYIGGSSGPDLDNAMWAVMTSPKGFSVSDLGSFPSTQQPKMSVFNLIKTLMSQRSGNKEMKEFFESKGHKFQTGGSPWVPGSGEGDRIPAMLEPGEFVVNKKAAKQYGGLLQDINFKKAPRFADGGFNDMISRVTPSNIDMFGSYSKVIVSMLPKIVTQMAKDFATGLQMQVSRGTYKYYNPLSGADAAGVKLANAGHVLPDYLRGGISAFKTGFQNPDVAFKNVPQHFNRLSTLLVNTGAAFRNVQTAVGDFVERVKKAGPEFISAIKTGYQNPDYAWKNIPFTGVQRVGYGIGALGGRVKDAPRDFRAGIEAEKLAQDSKNLANMQRQEATARMRVIEDLEKERVLKAELAAADGDLALAERQAAARLAKSTGKPQMLANGTMILPGGGEMTPEQQLLLSSGNPETAAGKAGRATQRMRFGISQMGTKIKDTFNINNMSMGKMMAGNILGMGIGQLAGMAAEHQEGTAKSAIQGLGTGAQMGAMFGPYGAAIGAVVGTLGGVAWGKISENMEKTKNAARGLADSLRPDAIAIEQLKIKIKDFSSVVIDSSGKTKTATSEFSQAVKAYMESDDETIKGAIANIKRLAAEANSAEIKKIATAKYGTDILASASTDRSGNFDKKDIQNVSVVVQEFLAAAGLGTTQRSGIVKDFNKINSAEDVLTSIFGPMSVMKTQQVAGGPGETSTMWDKLALNIMNMFGFMGSSTAPGVGGGQVSLMQYRDFADPKATASALYSQTSTATSGTLYDELIRTTPKTSNEVTQLRGALGNSTAVWTEYLKQVKANNVGLYNYDKQLKATGLDTNEIIVLNSLFEQGLQTLNSTQQKAIAQNPEILAGLTAQQDAYGEIDKLFGPLLEQASAKDQADGDVTAKRQKAAEDAITNEQKRVQKLVDGANSYIEKQGAKIQAIQEEVDARHKLEAAQDQEIQNEQTLAQLRSDITKAAGSGDLLALAEAQSKYNEELAREQKEKARQAKDKADQERIDAVQDTIDDANKKIKGYESKIKQLGESLTALQEKNSAAWNHVTTTVTTAVDTLQPKIDAFKAAIFSGDPVTAQNLYDKIFGNDKKGLAKLLNNAGLEAEDLKTLTADFATWFNDKMNLGVGQGKLKGILNDLKNIKNETTREQVATLAASIFAGSPGTTKQEALSQARSYYGVTAEGNYKSESGPRTAPTRFTSVGDSPWGAKGDWFEDPNSPGWYWYLDSGNKYSGVAHNKKYVQKALANAGQGNAYEYDSGMANWDRGSAWHKADGGYISGPGTGTSDSIRARLSNGEYVIKASAVSQYGKGFLDAVNEQRFKTGGLVVPHGAAPLDDTSEDDAYQMRLASWRSNKAKQKWRLSHPKRGFWGSGVLRDTYHAIVDPAKRLGRFAGWTAEHALRGTAAGLGNWAGQVAGAPSGSLRMPTSTNTIFKDNPYLNKNGEFTSKNFRDVAGDIGLTALSFVPMTWAARLLGKIAKPILKTIVPKIVKPAVNLAKDTVPKIVKPVTSMGKAVVSPITKTLSSIVRNVGTSLALAMKGLDSAVSPTMNSLLPKASTSITTEVQQEVQQQMLQRMSMALKSRFRPSNPIRTGRATAEYMALKDAEDLRNFKAFDNLNWEELKTRLLSDSESWNTTTSYGDLDAFAILTEQRKKLVLDKIIQDPKIMKLISKRDSTYSRMRSSIEERLASENVSPDGLHWLDGSIDLANQSGPLLATQRIVAEILGDKLLAKQMAKTTDPDASLELFFKKYGFNAVDLIRELKNPLTLDGLEKYGRTGKLGDVSLEAGHVMGATPGAAARYMADRYGSVKNLAEAVSLKSLKTIYPDIKWTPDTLIQVLKTDAQTFLKDKTKVLGMDKATRGGIHTVDQANIVRPGFMGATWDTVKGFRDSIGLMNENQFGYYSYNAENVGLSLFDDNLAAAGLDPSQITSTLGYIRAGDTLGSMGISPLQAVFTSPNILQQVEKIVGLPKGLGLSKFERMKHASQGVLQKTRGNPYNNIYIPTNPAEVSLSPEQIIKLLTSPALGLKYDTAFSQLTSQQKFAAIKQLLKIQKTKTGSRISIDPQVLNAVDISQARSVERLLQTAIAKLPPKAKGMLEEFAFDGEQSIRNVFLDLIPESEKSLQTKFLPYSFDVLSMSPAERVGLIQSIESLLPGNPQLYLDRGLNNQYELWKDNQLTYVSKEMIKTFEAMLELEKAGKKPLKKAQGGKIFGSGTGTSDSIPAMLSNGEYVVKASSVGKYGTDFLDAVNTQKFAAGGLATSKYDKISTQGIMKQYSVGGYGNSVESSFNDNSVYNINVSVDTNANPDDIANKIMATIQRQQASVSVNRTIGGLRR